MARLIPATGFSWKQASPLQDTVFGVSLLLLQCYASLAPIMSLIFGMCICFVTTDLHPSLSDTAYYAGMHQLTWLGKIRYSHSSLVASLNRLFQLFKSCCWKSGKLVGQCLMKNCHKICSPATELYWLLGVYHTYFYHSSYMSWTLVQVTRHVFLGLRRGHLHTLNVTKATTGMFHVLCGWSRTAYRIRVRLLAETSHICLCISQL